MSTGSKCAVVVMVQANDSGKLGCSCWLEGFNREARIKPQRKMVHRCMKYLGYMRRASGSFAALVQASYPLLLGSQFLLIYRARELRLLNLLCLVISRLHKT